jgi:thiol:disulfide interchange protein
MLRNPTVRRSLAVLIGIVGLMAFFWVVGANGKATTPAAFAEGLSFDEAVARADDRGTRVLVLATADWCIPCQRLKRGPLSDEQVAEVIRRTCEPVYLDVSDTSEPAVVELASRLGVGPIPALILLENGREIGRHEGYLSSESLLAWLGR